MLAKSKQQHMERMDVKKNIHDDRRKQDPKLLSLFTVLAEGDEKARIRSTESLLKQITAKQEGTEEARKHGISKDVEYTVNRLVQGLASGRKFARLGFSVALCQVLRSVDAVTIETVLETIDEKSNVLQDSSKSEAGNLMLGKVFGYLALIQSGRLFEGSKKNVKTVVSQLMELSTQKSYLQQLCSNALVQVIAKVKGKVYKKYILPLVEQQLTSGWSDCSADTFLLMLASHRHHTEAVSELLKEHWLDAQLVSEKNYAHISNVVMRSTLCYPVIHTVVDELVKDVLDKGLDIVKFWKQVVHPLFEVKQAAVPKRAIGLHIFSLILPALDTADKVQSVLHPDVVSVFVRYNKNRKDDLSTRAADLLTRLTDLVKSSSDAQLQVTILRCLIQEPLSHNFDELTGTKTVATITASLLPEASEMFVKELMNIFNQKPSWISAEKASKPSMLAWCVTEMVAQVTIGNLPSPWRLSVLQFLLIQGFFKITKSSSDIPHCLVRRQDITGGLQQSTRDNFYKTTSKLLLHHKQGESRVAEFGQSLDVLYQLVQYCQTLLENSGNVQLDVKDFTEEVEEEWVKVVNVLKAVDKKRLSEEKVKDGHAFELLFIHEAFQLLHDPQGATDMLQDLHVCYKKSGQRRKSKANNDEPPWIDVITELLLNLMFKDNQLCRNVAKFVFTALADHVTPDSLQLIVDTLKQKGLDNEEGIIGMEDEDNMEDDEDIEEDDAKGDKLPDEDVAGSSDSEEEEEEDSEVEEEDMKLEDQLKEKVKAALGDAAAESDDESEEEADMSDSEMFKLDSVLAEAFKSMRKGKKNTKEREKQLRIFKQRVLDLVEVLVKQAPSVTVIKMLPGPLIELMELGSRKEEDKFLGKKALGIYQVLCKAKKVSTDDPQEREELLAMISQMMTFSKKVSSPALVKEVGKGCLQVIRTLLNIQDQTGPSPLKTRAQSATVTRVNKADKDHAFYQERVLDVIRAGMLDMFAHKPGHCPPSFYHMLLERYPLMFWPLYTDLLTTITSTDIKIYQRTQAALFLSVMINSNLVRTIGTESWNEFVKAYRTTLEKAVKTVSASEVKVSFIRDLLAVVQKIQNVTPELVVQVLSWAVTNQLDALLPSLNPEVRTIYIQLVKYMKKGKRKHKQDKKKKKWSSKNESEATPEKKARLNDTERTDNHNSKPDNDMAVDNPASGPGTSPHKEKSPNKRKHTENDIKTNGKVFSPERVSKEGSQLDMSVGASKVDTPVSKRKKKHKKQQSSLDDSGFLNSSNGDLQSPEEGSITGQSSTKKAKLASNGLAVSNGEADVGDSPVVAIGKKAGMMEAKEQVKFSPKYTRSKKRQKDGK